MSSHHGAHVPVYVVLKYDADSHAFTATDSTWQSFTAASRRAVELNQAGVECRIEYVASADGSKLFLL